MTRPFSPNPGKPLAGGSITVLKRTWNTVAIVGVGLIGGSLGIDLLQRGLAAQVVGIGRREASLRVARNRGCVTRTTRQLERGVHQADLVVVCTPVSRVADDVRAVAAACRPGTLITDVGSTKRSIVEQLRGKLPAGVHFVGSHPLAGSEKNGPAAAVPRLFENRVVVVTPEADTPADDEQALEQFWSQLGARVVRMSPAEHDRALAAMSHMPHLVAYALAAATPDDYLHLAGGGWLDTTRIAASDPDLWRQIVFDNRSEVLKSLRHYQKTLAALRSALEHKDVDALVALMEQARRRRQQAGEPHAVGS